MKPKFLRKKFNILSLFCLTAIVGSCIIEESDFEKKFSTDLSLVQEATAWYGANYHENFNARINSLLDGDPLWNKARTNSHNGKSVIEIPINLRVKNIFANRDNNSQNKSGDYRLLLFKIGEGEFRPYIFKAEEQAKSFNPKWKELDQLNLTKIPSGFYGEYSFFKMDGRFIGSWKIQNGERTRAISFKRLIAEGSKDHSNARITEWGEFTCTVTTYTTYVQAGDADPYVVEQYEVWDCEYTYIPESMAPPSPDEGTGGQDPGCYEPHPDFEGNMVPCGSLDPDCPCCHLPEYQRAACEADEPPCEDLPLKNMEISATPAGKNGGRFGLTRRYPNGNPKPHDGLDLKIPYNSYVYSPFSGVVTRKDISHAPNDPKPQSYGNFVSIKSIDQNGNEFILRYAHLNYVLVDVGEEISAGQAIGISGETGNVDEARYPHVHILARKKDSDGNFKVKANPEDYLKIKWDSEGNISLNPCEN
ncbi:M23 family metallopeptidase [Algoriphagus sp. CAU 1675]|uniref:M23 family metallopeptidase n=1 Tax=Algoriphagus sp. CAU 1675 TaxID=3032597 RepID=UPI0023DCAE62|nr:M23 family metallopeptidase [Algoriphagus sp. CAU 1675]MDF2158774.1 M23 family metallopeptidase [Algoriphagus sp. CAU 1675]